MDIWETIKMFNSRKKIGLSDLIDVDFLQELQDDFANTMGVAALTVDYNGPITKPSNFTDFCTKHIRENELGAQRCNKCDIEGGKLAIEKGEPIIYTCHAGLTHFVVPIIVKGKHIASILGGQVSTVKPDEEHFKNIAKELGITKESEYIEALRKIQIVPEEKIKAAVKLLSLVANSISKIAHKNYELIEKTQREELTEKIIKKIRSTLDAEEIKRYFIDITQEYFEADRCIFADYDKMTNKFIPFRREKLKSQDIKSLIGLDLEQEFPEFCTKLKMGKDIIVRDLEKTISRKSLLGYRAIKTLKENETKSDYGLLVKCRDEIVGILILHFIKEKRVLSHDEFYFLKTIREHAGIALCQAELYEITKQQTERERVLRNVNNNIRSSLDLEEIKNKIVTQIGELFNADRVAIAYYDYKLNNYTITKAAEYRSSDNIKTFVDIDFVGTPGFTEYIRNTHFQGKDIIFNDIEKYLDENNFKNTDVETFYRNFGFVSSAAINIYYENKFLGDLVITFENKRKITEDEIEFFKAVADQAGVAFHQAELYQTTKQQAEKEFLIRNITETIRSTLDIDKTKKLIVDIVGETLKADRCFITEYDKKSDNFSVVKDEYLSSNEITCYKGFDSNLEVPHFVEIYKKRLPVLINNKEIFVDEKNIDFEIEKRAIEKFCLNSGFIVPLHYKEELLGTMSIHYIHEHFINEDEINLIKTIANQVAIAIHQAKLYNTTKELAKREKLLRSITETVRKSLNFDETKKSIVEQIGKTLNADRCFILEYNKANDKILIINEEYLSSDNIIPYKGVDLNEHIPSLVAEFKKGKRITVNESGLILNGEKINFESNIFADVKKAVERYKVKSALVFPLFYADEFLGDLVLHYVVEQHEVGEDEINFLNLISDQISLALYQSKLYEKVQLQAERERISRNIIEILRSTLDKNMIEHLFVRNIGQYFNANRVFFSEFDQNESKYLPIDEQSEYLSNIEEKSFKYIDFSDKSMGGHIKPLIDKRELIIPNWKRYLDENPKTPDLITLYEEAHVQSSYSFPVLYEGRIMGYFCIEFTHKINELMDEDINRLRSICTQAGIALYHAELYLEAQKALQSKGELIAKFKVGIEKPVDNILKTSKFLSELELERDKQKECLNNIINSCNQLLELTKDISNN